MFESIEMVVEGVQNHRVRKMAKEVLEVARHADQVAENACQVAEEARQCSRQACKDSKLSLGYKLRCMFHLL